MKMLRADWFMIFSLVLLIGAHITTNFLIMYYQDVAKSVGIAEEIAYEYEANPVAKAFLSIQNFKWIYSYVVAPGILLSLYYFLRRRYKNDLIVLETYAIAFLCFTGLDFLNDVSLLLGFLMRGYI